MIHTPFQTPPPEGGAVEIADGIMWMRLPLPMVLDHVNVYALADDDGWTIVDTGFDTPRNRSLWDGLLTGPLAGRPVARVLATHHHADHIGLAGWLMARDGAGLMTSQVAWLMTRMLSMDRQDLPTTQMIAFWRRAGMDPAILAERAGARPFNTSDVVYPLPQGYARLSEGQVLTLAGRRWRVALGDGHAPRHVTLWSQDDPLVIAGDQILAAISPNLGVYPTEPDADPVGEWLDSCARMQALSRDDHLVLPGHRLPFTGAPFRLSQMIQNHLAALSRVETALRAGPRTATGCFDLLFKRRIGPAEYGLALVEAVAHINHLAHTGRIRAMGERDGAVLWGA